MASIDEEKEIVKMNTGNVTEGTHAVLEIGDVLLVGLVDLITMAEELLEGDGAEGHGLEQVEIGAGGGDAAIEAL